MIDFQLEKEASHPMIAKIKVIGVGGAGGNTVNSIIDSGYQAIEFVVINTDAQALEYSKAPKKIQIGVKSSKGLGTGADPEMGKRTAEEDIDKIMQAVGDADIVFIAAGMGGGTGSGAAPVVARALREKGILSIAIVTKPFLFEGNRRARVAERAIEILAHEVDTLIVIQNQKLLELSKEKMSMIDGFAMINDVLTQSVRGISDIIAKPGHINVDFADVRAIMKDRGLAIMGTARATGEHRARQAAMEAISSPLLENMSIVGVHGVLLNISGGKNLGLHEISEAASVIYEQAAEDANIIIGSVIDESLNDEVVVTIIATGFDHEALHPQVDRKSNVHVRATVLDRQIKEQPIKQEPVELKNEVIQEPILVHEPVSTAIHAQEIAPSMQEQKLETRSSVLLDMNDLDVPTFLRKEQGQ